MQNESKKTEEPRVNEMYRTFSPTPLSSIERNRPGKERKEEQERGMRRQADSFSGKDMAFQDVPLTEMGHRSICPKKTRQDKHDQGIY